MLCFSQLALGSQLILASKQHIQCQWIASSTYGQLQLEGAPVWQCSPNSVVDHGRRNLGMHELISRQLFPRQQPNLQYVRGCWTGDRSRRKRQSKPENGMESLRFFKSCWQHARGSNCLPCLSAKTNLSPMSFSHEICKSRGHGAVKNQLLLSPAGGIEVCLAPTADQKVFRLRFLYIRS